MISLPVSATTFKRSFLGGDGNLEINSDQNDWTSLFSSNAPFSRTVDNVADVQLKLGTTRALTLGGENALKIGVTGGVEALHQIQLIWPGSEVEPGILRGLKPGDAEVLVRLLLQGKADASAKGSVPAGPLSASFGVGAGGSITYELLQLRPASTPARTVLVDLFAGLCLPQQVTTADQIPGPGEVVATRFSGYLTLNGKLSYGYSMTGSRDIEIGKLNLDLDYALKLSAGVTAAYRLAGEFDIEARAGSTPGFVRFAVRKSRESKFNFAADFGVEAGVHLTGLPDTADEFLVKAFGAHAERGLKLFDKVRQYDTVEELETAAGKLLKGAIHQWSPRLIGKALSNGTLKEYLAKAQQVITEYNKIDQRLIGLYEDFVDNKLPNLASTLDQLGQATSRDRLKEIAGPEAWALITRLTGPELYDILLDDQAFGTFRTLVGQAKDLLTSPAQQAIRDVVKTFQEAFPLDGVLKQLGQIQTPEELTQLADEKLQGLAEQLLGRAFDEIRPDATKALAELRATLDKVETFKKNYYDKLKAVTNHSFEANLHFAFARASASDQLLDVEVDVTTSEGSALAALAAGGDFAELLSRFDSKLVRIHKGVFTHSLETSTQVQVNLFGYGLEGFTRVFQESEDAIEAHDGGLLHIYTTKTQVDERRQNGGELTATTFLIATVAKGLQTPGSRDFLLRTLPKMSVQYDLLQEDDKTQPEEMRQILDLAELVGILPDRESFLGELRAEFPGGLGKVSAKYVIRYDSDAVTAAFLIPDNPKRDKLRALATAAMRTFIATRYISMRPTDWAASFGFAYLDPATNDLFQRLGFAQFANTAISLTLPAWFTKGSPQRIALQNVQKQALITMYGVERQFLDRLVRLDTTLDALNAGGAVKPGDLDSQVKGFVSMAPKLNDFRTNAFFAVFDRLVMEGSGGKALRQSALVLEITPAGGTKVTKVLTAATARPEIADVEDATVARATVAGG